MSLWHRFLLFWSLKPRKIFGLALVFVLFMTGALGSTAFGQEYTDIRTLGTSNAVFKPGPQTGEDLQRMFSDHRADYEKVLRDTNWPGDPLRVFVALLVIGFAVGPELLSFGRGVNSTVETARTQRRKMPNVKSRPSPCS